MSDPDGIPNRVSGCEREAQRPALPPLPSTNDVSTLDNPYADTNPERLQQKVNELLDFLRR